MPKDEKKEEKKDEDKVVLKVGMHCTACREEVEKSMRGFPGVGKIDVDMNAQKVTIKGKVDAQKLIEQVKRKCGKKRTELLYPELKKKDEKKKEEKKEEKKKEPADVTVVLKVNMHCDACGNEVKKSLQTMDGVYHVKADVSKGEVTIKGRGIDPKEVCKRVMKKTGRQAEVVQGKKDGKKGDGKEGGKNKEEGKEEGKEGDQSKKSEATDGSSRGIATKYVYPPQCFSDENPNACYVM